MMCSLVCLSKALLCLCLIHVAMVNLWLGNDDPVLEDAAAAVSKASGTVM